MVVDGSTLARQISRGGRAPNGRGRSRTQQRPSSPRLSRLLVAALVIGTLLAVAPAVAAVVLLLDQRAQAGGGAADASLVLRKPADAPNGEKVPPVRVDVKARHRGNLALDVSAAVTVQGRALFKGDVVAYADMKQMPGVHSAKPSRLRESPGQRGVYRGTVRVPMVGDWEVRVAARGPGVRGEGARVFSIGAVDGP
jgi:hypothetical protein